MCLKQDFFFPPMFIIAWNISLASVWFLEIFLFWVFQCLIQLSHTTKVFSRNWQSDCNSSTPKPFKSSSLTNCFQQMRLYYKLYRKCVEVNVFQSEKEVDKVVLREKESGKQMKSY